jgi:AcrR family transcriptional regulator
LARPREHDEATRERLVQAAEAVTAAEGWDALTVRRVAQEAGTSTRAVYTLFDSKEGLEQALHLAFFERLRDLLKASPRSEDPRADLIELALAYRRWAVERPQRYELAIHRFIGPFARPRSERGLAVARDALDELRHVVRRCQEAGLIDAGHELETVVRQAQVTTHGLAEFENLGVLGDDPDRFWRNTVSALLAGLSNGKPPHLQSRTP